MKISAPVGVLFDQATPGQWSLETEYIDDHRFSNWEQAELDTIRRRRQEHCHTLDELRMSLDSTDIFPKTSELACQTLERAGLLESWWDYSLGFVLGDLEPRGLLRRARYIRSDHGTVDVFNRERYTLNHSNLIITMPGLPTLFGLFNDRMMVTIETCNVPYTAITVEVL